MPATAPAQRAYSQQDLQRDLDAITATGVPGVLAKVRVDGRELRGTSGVANLDSRAPVDVNGFFRIGSNTKTFVSVVVLEFQQFSRPDLLDIALSHQPTSAPGAAWNYSNTSYLLLGLIIEKVTHHSGEDQVTRRIIEPLGLHDTFAPGTSTRLPQPHATGYLIFDKKTRVDTTAENVSWANSAGALISTASDLSRFWSALGRGTLLPPAQLREMEQTVPAGRRR